MSPCAEIGVIVAWTLVSFAGGCYVTSKFDEAGRAEALRAQVEADRQAVREANDHAADLERDLATERQKQSSINQQMEAALANVHDCPVPDRFVRVLNDAITPAAHAAR